MGEDTFETISDKAVAKLIAELEKVKASHKTHTFVVGAIVAIGVAVILIFN